MPKDTAEYYMDQLAKLYTTCLADKELDKQLGEKAGIDSGYLTVALEMVLSTN